MLYLLLSCFTGAGILISTSYASLPSDLDATLREIAQNTDADWGIGVIDFESGDERTLNAERQFVIGIPHLPLAAAAIELSNTGEISLNDYISRGERWWERLHWAQQGGRGMCMAVIWTIGIGRLNELLDEGGCRGTLIEGVQQDVPHAPEFDSNYITAADGLSFLEVVYDNLDQESVRNIGSNPPLSDYNRETLGFGNKVYGWIDVSSSSKLIFLIIDLANESDIGLVLLAEDIDDVNDADRALRMLYEELTD